MGSLNLPQGPVYIDACVVIYSVERHPDFFPLLRPLWEQVQDGTREVVTSELSLLETLVAPLRRTDDDLMRAYEGFFRQRGVRLLPIGQAVLREAARLRAVLPLLRTPDAIHAASALLCPCAAFLTNDPAFRQVRGLTAMLLRDAMTDIAP